MNATICQTNEPIQIEPDHDLHGYAFEVGVMAPSYERSQSSPDELKVYELARKLTRSTCKNEHGEELILITQEAVDLASDYLHYQYGGYGMINGRCMSCLDHLGSNDHEHICRWCDERFAAVKARLDTNRVNN